MTVSLQEHAARERRNIVRAATLGWICCAQHIHPSGDPHPSPADVQTTKKLKTAAACLDIRVIDHIVITPHDHCSLAALNLI